MSRHAHHRMHANSVEAHAWLDHEARRARILGIFTAESVRLTDREIMRRLGFIDPNKVRPYITRLIQDGALVESGSMKDAETRRTVRLCTLAGPRQMHLVEAI